MLTDMNSKFKKEGLTFDDVLLIPAESDVAQYDRPQDKTYLNYLTQYPRYDRCYGYRYGFQNGYRYRP